MDILLSLLEHRGEVVGADELLASVWRGIVVEPTALRVQVSALRKALAAVEPSAAGYISSVAGRGYCFVAPVRREADSARTSPTPGAHSQSALPAPRRMIGRDALADTLERTIASERFVTLVGPGGIGKTTLALALAHRLSPAFDGEVAFVDLAIQKGDDSVAPAVATALQLTRLEGDPVADIASQLQSRRLLLVLDSCEHVIAGAATLAEVVCQGAPQCHIVATSREPLSALGEQVRRLDALETPPREALSFGDVCGYPAAQLFVERVAAGGTQIERGEADAALVADICRKLDGIPLAIELAAGRVDAFGLSTTHALLDSRLQLTWRGLRTAPPRHVTLGATLDWSYDLLSSEEAALLRALSMFVSWFPLDAAEAIVDAALRPHATAAIAGLVAKSLVSADRGRTPVQYRLLDTTRDYARLRLEDSGELASAAARHAAWILNDLAQPPTERLAERADWVEHYNNRIQDAQSAIDWSLSGDGDRSLTVPLTLASRIIWGRLHRNAQETRRRIEAALSIVDPDSRDEMLLNIALSEALLDFAPYDVGRAETAAARALELANGFDEPSSELEARWNLWGTHILTRPNIPKAQEQALQFSKHAALHRSRYWQIMAELMVSISEFVAGNLAAARAASDRAEALGAARSNHPNSMRISVLWLSGMPDTASAAAQVNLERARASRNAVHEAAVLADSFGTLAMYVGDWTEANACADMIDQRVAHGAFLHYRTWAQALCATVAAQRGDAGPGRQFLSGPLPTECGHPRFASVLTELALRVGAAGAEDIARDLADRLLQRIETTGERWIWSEVQRVRGELAEDPAEAEALFEAALAVAQKQGARAWELRAATSLARRRRSAAEDVLRPLLASFTEGAGTQDIIEARAVLSACGVDLLEASRRSNG
jgi:predicted ATPase